MHNTTITLDVREDIRSGREPFSKIMTAVNALRDGDQLRVIAPFEPAPLFSVLAKRGFQHTARATGAGDWEVLFTRRSGAPPAEPKPAAASDSAGGCPTSGSTECVEVDARGLEPPQPMIKILEALAGVPATAELRARTDRRPMHLYARLEECGYRAETEEQSDGSFLTHIRRR